MVNSRPLSLLDFNVQRTMSVTFEDGTKIECLGTLVMDNPAKGDPNATLCDGEPFELTFEASHRPLRWREGLRNRLNDLWLYIINSNGRGGSYGIY